MDELSRKRSGIKVKLNLFASFIESLNKKASKDEILSVSEIYELKERLNHAVDFITQFDDYQNELEAVVDPTKMDAEYTERENFYSKFYSQIASARQILKNYDATSELSSNNSSNKAQRSCINTCQSAAIHLKPIELPRFDGSYNNWLEFADLFESLVNRNDSLDNIRRFHYLRNSLEGGAAQVIKSLEFTAENYSVAWKLIRERYDNKRILISNHINALFNIENIQRESSQKLRQLIDVVSKHLYALKQIGLPTESWDVLLIHIISNKFDNSTRRAWENSNAQNDIPQFEEFKTFLKSRADFLESLEVTQADKKHSLGENTSGYSRHQGHKPNQIRGFLSSQDQSTRCPVCKNSHSIYQCTDFMKLSPKEKFDKARTVNICTNCLKPGHFYKQCTQLSCKKCSSKHHTLLHPERQNYGRQNNTPNDETRSLQHSNSGNAALPTTPPVAPPLMAIAVSQAPDNSPNLTNLTFSNIMRANQVMLSTVLINVFDRNNKMHTVRALLDCGSQSSFISDSLCEKVRAERQPVNLSVVGVNNTSTLLKHKCNVNVQSTLNSFSAHLNCFIVPEITGNIPVIDIDIRDLKIPNNLKLADPSFYKAGKIEMLIGNDLFWNILHKGRFSLGENKPFMQKTAFGWILAGPYLATMATTDNLHIKCNFTTNVDIQRDLSRFWELEEVCQEKPVFSSEEMACERLFEETSQRDASGRFIVTLPLKEPLHALGESLEHAKNRFLNLERKLEGNYKIKQMYVEFIEEYKYLGHMKKVGEIPEQEVEGKLHTISSARQISYYMPHHGVLRENAMTTRLRVVFDCSASTTSGLSLNSIQMAGPSLQSDLISILLRFRIHLYVVSADIEKMYRQVLVREDQRALQRILWRENRQQPLEIYELLTVTYGMKCSSYLATKCLMVLGQEQQSKNPKISEIIMSDFYVDDLLTGFESIDDARNACTEISEVLRNGGFPLRKFYSNEPRILENIDRNSNVASVIQFGENENAKTLGLSWAPNSDFLLYKINTFSCKNLTKRRMMSDVAQIFDPLGLLSACTILAKIMLQKLWLERVSWDDSLPTHLQNSYFRFRNQLAIINNLRIPRHVKCPDAVNIEVHGFCDASQNAYGACIYIKSTDRANRSYSYLLCAKSKVAPVKPVTLPRLELCGAVVLSRLVNKVTNSIKLQFNSCYLWSDSSIVLSWLKTSANTLKTFVSNRVTEIQENTAFAQWFHVPSKDNPADLLSRGVEPEKIIHMDLWWHGPHWLLESREHWPNLPIRPQEILETRKSVNVFASNLDNRLNQNIFPFERFSNLNRLKRCAAYMFRFIRACKNKTKYSEPLSAREINESFKHILKLAQAESFAPEIRCLTQDKKLERSSKILNLAPFIDEFGILRVGGRLENSEFAYDKKHPIILSSNHALTKCIFDYYHTVLMHAGPQLLLYTVREVFWPISGRNLARRTVHKCVTCFRNKPKLTHPMMGNLPAQRLISGPPFSTTGVDYAGPFLIRDRKGRGCKLSKGYICLFICFSTKAIHIELATELSKDAFLLCFKRFISRRGKPQQIFSDNGSNFVAANAELKAIQRFLSANKNYFVDSLSRDSITWTFSPPYSPHFGGLWEAGVKIVKHHLHRVLGNAHLTYEEFYSVLVQIEAIINSRPIHPLSNDPNDFSPLTPAHFLIGQPLTTTPDPDYCQTPVNRLSRYQFIQQLSQHVWARWNKEYVSELQTRTKWKSSNGEISPGVLVLIKEDNLPPMKWKLGRVVEALSGSDGRSRVFRIKTVHGLITRSFSKICPLPGTD